MFFPYISVSLRSRRFNYLMAAWISSRLCVPSQNGRFAVCLQLHNQYSLSAVTVNFIGHNFICKNGLLWVPSYSGWNNADKKHVIHRFKKYSFLLLTDSFRCFMTLLHMLRPTVTWSGKLSWPVIRYCLSYIYLKVLWKIINTSEYQSSTGSKFKLRTLQL